MENSAYNPVYLGLGSNLGDRQEILYQAATMLEMLGCKIVERSTIYETAPWGNLEQAPFLNQVLVGNWAGGAMELLQALQEVERNLGRIREELWGPRTIDVDILGMGTLQVKSQRLTVPHPYLHQRAFVLVPLAEVAAEWEIPGVGTTASAALEALPQSEIAGVMPFPINPELR